MIRSTLLFRALARPAAKSVPQLWLKALSSNTTVSYGALYDASLRGGRRPSEEEWYEDRYVLHFEVLRKELAQAIEESLLKNGFLRLDQKDPRTEKLESQVGCRIYSRPLSRNVVVDPDIGTVTLRVRSSIDRHMDQVTESGQQPIHVYLEYSRKDGGSWKYERMVDKSTKIMRVGKVASIVHRMEARIRELEDKADAAIRMCPSCHEAPLFKSKRGNWVCSHFCWVQDENQRVLLATEDPSEALLESLEQEIADSDD